LLTDRDLLAWRVSDIVLKWCLTDSVRDVAKHSDWQKRLEWWLTDSVLPQDWTGTCTLLLLLVPTLRMGPIGMGPIVPRPSGGMLPTSSRLRASCRLRTPEAGLSVPRRACLSRGGPVRPEAGLSVPSRACPSRGGPACPEAGYRSRGRRIWRRWRRRGITRRVYRGTSLIRNSTHP